MEYGEAVVVDRLSALETPAARPVVYDRDVGVLLLHRDPATGAEHYLVRYPPGVRVRLHRHTAAHTIVLLEGSLAVNGAVIGPGSYCHFPAGEAMVHAPASSAPCLFVTIFDGPFDVHPADE